MWQANWLFSGIKGDGMKKTVKTVKKEYAIWIFVLLVFVFYLSWALAAPFDASPDESMRYQIVEFIVKHGTLPDGRDPEIRNANWGISYAFNPILPYMAGAVFAKVVQVFTDSFRATVIAARMVCLENRRTVISEKRDREAVYSSGVLSSGNLFSVFLYQYGWTGTFYDSLDPVLLVQGV